MDATTWLSSVINGYRGTALVGVAARLGLADHIADGHQSLAQLAAVTGTHNDRLRHVLRALVALGLIVETDDGCLEFTQFGELLRADHPQSLKHSAAYAASVSSPAYDGLLESLRSDECAFQHRFGTDFYTHLANKPDLAEHFNNMLSFPGLDQAVAGALSLAGVRSVVDVGGGEGAILAELLRANPHVHGVLFDLPEIIGQGIKPSADPALTGRYTALPGNFLDSVPSAGELYAVIRVLANWNDNNAALILRNCRAAMRDGDRLVVVEQLMPERAEVGAFINLGNVDLVVNFGGHLRTESEFELLFKSAQLRQVSLRRLTVSGNDNWAVLEAEPIS